MSFHIKILFIFKWHLILKTSAIMCDNFQLMGVKQNIFTHNEILNLEGHQNRITGSRVTGILLKKGISYWAKW